MSRILLICLALGAWSTAATSSDRALVWLADLKPKLESTCHTIEKVVLEQVLKSKAEQASRCLSSGKVSAAEMTEVSTAFTAACTQRLTSEAESQLDNGDVVAMRVKILGEFGPMYLELLLPKVESNCPNVP